MATPPAVALEMLSLARVQASDVVYDLGCGDGRIVILAAKAFGARGVGIDIDPQRIAEAERRAAAAGVSGRVRFLQADLFYAGLGEATVVTMFLLPTINEKLRPRLWRELRPGTRVVTHTFEIAGWRPRQRASKDGVPVYLWTVPRTRQWRGRVLLENGTAAPAATAVERFRGALVRFEGYTEADGGFSIAWPLDEDPAGWRVRALLPGYRSETAALAREIGVIRLHRTSTRVGTLASDSPPARAWFERGRGLEAGGRLEEARAAYEKAIAADPNYISPCLGLVQLANYRNDWREVTRWAETVLRLDPENFPEAWLFHAVGSLTLGRLDAAEKSARQAVRLDPGRRFPRAEYVLGLALEMKGDAEGAREHFAHYLELDPKAPDAAAIRAHLGR